jgi:hypothetical protein
MNPFAGKSPTERNKIIAALVLGVLALGSLFFAFGGSIFSKSPKVTVSISPTPSPSATVPIDPVQKNIPTQTEQNFAYATTPVVYNGVVSGPDPGRNIFAFYEPAQPCGAPTNPCPLPPVKTPVPPTPTPTPEIYITAINPSNVYAGSRGFRLEITGERMVPEAKIYFSQSPLPTTFVNAQRMTADVPANFIAGEAGGRQIMVQTPDGKKYSQSITINVQAPPKPGFQYIGMIARKRSNNDTAYFMDQGRQTPVSARLNDVVGGRFRLVSISAEETVFEDVSLGFRHKVPLYRPAPGTSAGSPSRPSPAGDNYVPYNPNTNFQVQPGQSIPGIPDNIPRYVPPNANKQTDKKDQDDDDDGDGKP